MRGYLCTAVAPSINNKVYCWMIIYLYISMDMPRHTVSHGPSQIGSATASL